MTFPTPESAGCTRRPGTTELGISYWSKNYATRWTPGTRWKGREYPYYDPIHLLPEKGQEWWRARIRDTGAGGDRRDSGLAEAGTPG